MCSTSAVLVGPNNTVLGVRSLSPAKACRRGSHCCFVFIVLALSLGCRHPTGSNIAAVPKGNDVNNQVAQNVSSKGKITYVDQPRDELERNAVRVALDWYQSQVADHDEIEVQISKSDDDAVYVSLGFVARRDERGDAVYFLGGTTLLKISRSGEVLKVIRGH